MDNSFDKLNDEFADKARGGFKYWFYLVLGYVFAGIGAAIGVFSLLPGNNKYLSLLTLLFGLFGLQAVFKAKGTQGWNLNLRINMIFNAVVLVFSCVILYIILPYIKG